MRENEKDTIHQLDIWHFCKSIKKKLATVAKKEAMSSFEWMG